MEFSGLIHIAIMMVLFIGLVVAIAWVFQGVTEGEENIERRRGDTVGSPETQSTSLPCAPHGHKVEIGNAHQGKDNISERHSTHEGERSPC